MRRIRGRLPVLAAGRRRADVAHHLAERRLELLVLDRPAALQIDALGRRDRHERICRQHFSIGPIDHVDVAVAIRAHHHLARAAADRKVREHRLVDAVVIPEVVRRHLIEPDRFAGIGVAREDAGGPLVVARTLLVIPRTRVRCSVVDEIQLRVVRDPAPHRAAAVAPGVGRPRVDAEIPAAVGGVERLEARADEDLLVGPGRIGAPRDRSGPAIERRQPAAHAQLAAGIADQHLVLDDERRHRDRLALVHVAQLGDPLLFAARGVECDGAVVERVEEDRAVRVDDAAVDDVAAGDALGRGQRLRLVLPFHRRAVLRQVERVHVVRPRRDDVHRVVDDDRRRLVPVEHARREGGLHGELPHVLRSDLIERAEPRARIVARRAHPVAAGVWSRGTT